MTSIRRDVLEEAADLIDGDRNAAYGSPTQNFANIAAIWNVQFAHMLVDGAQFEPRHVAEAMISVKLARCIASPKRDNYVDIAGYAGCGAECAQAPQEEDPDVERQRIEWLDRR